MYRVVVLQFLIFHVCIQALSIEYETTTDITPDPCPKKLNLTKPNYIEECTKESRVNRNYINKLKSGFWNVPKITTSLKYWAYCYLRRNDMMSEAGVLRQDVVLKNIAGKERDNVVRIIDKCLYKEAHLPMETAWHYLYCFHSINKKLCKRLHGI